MLTNVRKSFIPQWRRKQYSFAVARGPLDRFNSKIPPAQRFSTLLVTSASYLPVRTIRFCSVIFCVTSNLAVMHMVRGRVQCETTLGRSRTVGYARGAWWANTRIGLPAKPTTGAIYNQVEAVIGRKARHSLRIEILTYPTCIRRPRLGGYRRNIAMPFGVEQEVKVI